MRRCLLLSRQVNQTSRRSRTGFLSLQQTTAGDWLLGGGLEVAMHDGWFWRSEVRYSDYSKGARVITGAPVVSSAILNFRS